MLYLFVVVVIAMRMRIAFRLAASERRDGVSELGVCVYVCGITLGDQPFDNNQFAGGFRVAEMYGLCRN